MNYKVLHTADTHLRARQYSRSSRGEDFLKAFHSVVDTAVSEQVDMILNSGDILDSTRPTPQVMRGLMEVHNRLIKSSIPMYVVSGNHDRTEPHWSSVLVQEDGAKGGIICVDYQLFKHGDLQIQALPFMHREAYLRWEDEENENGSADILMWHAPIQEFCGFPNPSAISLEQFPAGKYTWVAMGDIHVRASMELDDGTVVSYPGSTELCSKGEATEKSVDLVVIEKTSDGSRILSMDKKEIPTRKVFTLSISSDDQVAPAIAEVAACLDEEPLVFLRYSPEVSGVVRRFKTQLDTDRCIFRHAAQPRCNPDRDDGIKDHMVENKIPQEFLDKFVTPGTDLFSLGLALLEPTGDPESALESYVEKALS